jgi:hypothetical protein
MVYRGYLIDCGWNNAPKLMNQASRRGPLNLGGFIGARPSRKQCDYRLSLWSVIPRLSAAMSSPMMASVR